MAPTDERLREARREGSGGESAERESTVRGAAAPGATAAPREGRTAERGGTTAGRGGVRDRLRARAGRVFSPRSFLVALALSLGGLLAAGAVLPPFVPLGGLLGVFGAGFALGLAGRRRYLEVGLAGAGAAAAAFLLGHLVLSLLGAGIVLTAAGAGAGGLAGVLGHYFGRDLRAGATRELS